MRDHATVDSSSPPVAPAELATAPRPFGFGVPFAPAYPAALLLTGLSAGLAGMSLALLLHAIQHIAYDYSLDTIVGSESFLEGVNGAPPLHRLAVLVLCGAIAGIGWWALYRFGRKLVSIRAAMAKPETTVPALETIVHSVLQIVTVALGSPLGREVAPREAAALLAGWIARCFRLSPEDTRVMLACGAGAGLAAVYNVPLGGAVFVMEVLLNSFAIPVAIPAITTSAIAAYVAWIGLGDAIQYQLPHLGISLSLVVWSAVAGPVFGCSGSLYAWLAQAARARAPRDAWIVPACLAAFTCVGVFSMAYPEVPGNGKGPIQLGLDGEIGPRLAAILLAVKLLSTSAVLWAGAGGGLLTPGLTIGALLGLVMGGVWTLFWPTTAAAGAFALVGSIAFLAVSMRMPVTAIVLVFDFTRADHDFLIPALIAVAGAVAASRLVEPRA